MALWPLVTKELTWSRRRIVPLFLLVVVLPASFAYVTTGFDDVLPTDTPVAIVAQSDAVTQDDIAIGRAALTFFSDPRTFDDNASAFEALRREQVYAVVTVPPGVTNESTTSTFHVYVHGSMVPYHQPSEAVVSVLRYRLRSVLSGSVTIQRHIIGQRHSLSAYLIPTFVMVLVMLLALGYLPYTLAADQPALDRLRVDANLDAVVAAKLLYYAAVLVVPLAVFQAASTVLGYGLSLTIGTVIVSVLTFLTLGAIGCAIALITRFSPWGRLANILLLMGLFLFSGLLYPAGFFSPVRRTIVRLLPTHYATILLRSSLLRSTPAVTPGRWYLGLLALTVVATLVLAGSIRIYERRSP
ncbi:MAG: ABC transporter permease [Halobacteriaceae archaeon]